ncbi:fatty acid-binding protein, liver-like isoform X1 [Entelurus aequoreus]|uniref:fatty acid-binding protein, liver-like isoform X1 n=1 Tax=Entelurus aequoreus TaxID=161455 RepID=UPI002B1D2A13|nr:fatty acid-binding protein, liver-like isoform X1 [Entelurus aequoreus]
MPTSRETTTKHKPLQAADMDFSGTWQVYSEENLEGFLRALGKIVQCLVFLSLICAFMLTCLFVGAPEMVVKMRKKVRPLIVIERKGKDLSYTLKTPNFTVTNSISIGKEAEITAIDGRKVECTVREENGKLITESDKFTSVREIQGQEMIETVTAGSAILISRSRRV